MISSITFNKFVDIYHDHRKVFLTFLAMGALTALINFSCFAFFYSLLKINRFISVSLSYMIAAAFHFFGNRKLTFKVQNSQYLIQIIKYISLLIINYFLTIGVLQFSLIFISSPYIGLIFANGATAISGYLFSKFWIFAPTTSQLEA